MRKAREIAEAPKRQLRLAGKPSLPIAPPFPAMEALPATALPQGPEWQYEPKWDGFRCMVFRSGSDVKLQSKGGQPLGRYFPELVEAVLQRRPRQFVLDSEIVIPIGKQLSFDDLLMRIHPAESRIRKLASDTPALLIVFDLLVDDRGQSLLERPLSERRLRLEAFARRFFADNSSMRLSPMTQDYAQARKWYQSMAGLDGIVAKRRDAPYEPGMRSGVMQKIKRLRTADCVVGGFRYASKGKVVGSLLLGLYDNDGLLHHVGFTFSMAAADRKQLTKKVEALIKPPGFTGKAPGGLSRWSTKRSMEWEPLDPVLVAEVRFDHFTGGRFRHGTKLLRWRPDKSPRQCTMDQVQAESRSSLQLLGGFPRDRVTA
jgi:ATP-dependent DNA ligase